MTKKEYELWRDETLKSKNKWQMDCIHCQKDDCWFYFGGENGKFIMVVDNWLNIGNYKNAIPHIGDASFYYLAERQFTSNEAAWKYLLERAGIPFLIDLYSTI